MSLRAILENTEKHHQWVFLFSFILKHQEKFYALLMGF